MSANVCWWQTVQLWTSQINLFNYLINLWNWGCWGLACSKSFFLILGTSCFWQNVFQAKMLIYIFFLIFPSMNVVNSITLYYYSLRGGSLYKCEFWQAAKCSCVTVPWAETYWYLRVYSRCNICKAGWIICMFSAYQAHA